ncbi:arylsulfatase [bacterium]|nr:arylsulfatase [bacterium]
MLKKTTCAAFLAVNSLMLSISAGAAQNGKIPKTVTGNEITRRPNIVLILADDLGFTDLGAYGSEISTPNIDRLANQGVKFSNYHTCATCAPSRAMLLTGVDSHLAGVPNIPESIPPEQSDYDNYKGVLNNKVATVASRLHAGGYHTYMTGKWHLGKTDNVLPFSRGFERTLSMADTGADNWEQRPYMAMYDHAHWTRDGKEVQLKEPFYSSELLVDEMIQYIDSNLADGKPFFSFVSFLAVHAPVQAPKEYTDRYLNTYKNGWGNLRAARHNRALEIGLVPKGTERVEHPFIEKWDSLSEKEKQFEAKRMAVYAGMASAMDYHIGRLLDYLEESGQIDNTVFIFTSDNGPEHSIYPYSSIASQGYTQNYDDLGEIGSFNYIGPNYASAAASPLSYFKFYTGEGGLRVPLIISGSGIEARTGFENAAVHVADITPTILALAGADQVLERFGGRKIEPMTGKDLTPLLEGSVERVYQPNDYTAYEVAGNIALFNDRYKIVLNRKPLGDNEWYLFDIVNDPGEAKDLKAQNPRQFQHMLNLYQHYAKEKGVQPVPDHYIQDAEIEHKVLRNMFSDLLLTWLFVLLTLGLFALYARQCKKGNVT